MLEYGLVVSVEAGSVSDAAGVRPGDRLTSMGGYPLTDVLDFQFMSSAEHVDLGVTRANAGEEVIIHIVKGAEESLGINLAGTGLEEMRQCENRCTFCFIDQLPEKVRDSLRVKDDDYVHSFLNGNYVSLTNCRDADIERIVRLRLSPVFVSVHTTNPQLRQRMMHNPRAAGVLETLQTLTSAVSVHAQLVLVPGVNDGAELMRTLSDLLSLGPNLASVSAVPVGLTRFRNGLDDLRPYSASEARDVVRQVEAFQEHALCVRDTRFVYASDEFYLKAGLVVPPDSAYHDYPQLTNGVGLVRQFLDGFDKVLGERLDSYMASAQPEVVCSVVTGTLAAPMLSAALARLPGDAFRVRVVPVPNKFFGETVTVAGLMTAGDIVDALADENAGQFVVIPDVCLREGDGIFLDGATVAELEARIGVPVIVSDSTARGLVKVLMGRDFGRPRRLLVPKRRRKVKEVVS